MAMRLYEDDAVERLLPCVEHRLALQFPIVLALLAVSTEEGIPCDAVNLAAVDRQDI